MSDGRGMGVAAYWPIVLSCTRRCSLLVSLYSIANGEIPIAEDPDNDSLTFFAMGLPAWAEFNPITGQLGGTPGAGDVGTYSGIGVGVTDGTGNVSLALFSIDVVAAYDSQGLESPHSNVAHKTVL